LDDGQDRSFEENEKLAKLMAHNDRIEEAQLFTSHADPGRDSHLMSDPAAESPNILNISTKHPTEARISYPGCDTTLNQV
jgi:hypothetical protein